MLIIITHLCELVDGHQQENGMWTWFYQGHCPQRLRPNALLHLASRPVPPRCLHQGEAPAIEGPASQLAALGVALRDGRQLTQDGVC